MQLTEPQPHRTVLNYFAIFKNVVNAFTLPVPKNKVVPAGVRGRQSLMQSLECTPNYYIGQNKTEYEYRYSSVIITMAQHLILVGTGKVKAFTTFLNIAK